jgi:hypothetical protein
MESRFQVEVRRPITKKSNEAIGHEKFNATQVKHGRKQWQSNR